MRISHTVDIRGAISVQIVDESGDSKQRFATVQITGRAVNPQNVPLCIIYLGKSTKEDPAIPIFGKFLKKLLLYDQRVHVLWNGKAYQ